MTIAYDTRELRRRKLGIINIAARTISRKFNTPYYSVVETLGKVVRDIDKHNRELEATSHTPFLEYTLEQWFCILTDSPEKYQQAFGYKANLYYTK